LQHIELRFGAKRSAFWCKMQHVLMLNAIRFGAYCSRFCCIFTTY